MEFVHTDVDGVPTLWSPEGPLRAGLVFRVGRADETLATGGITHLLEHLALHRLGIGEDVHFNGATGAAMTAFVAHGRPDEVSEFFASVCAGLRDLPVDRLATEKAIVQTEAHGRDSTPGDRLATWRYGPASYGLPAYPEFGLDTVTIEDLRAWSARWFTRGNAALWISGGPPPAGLRLDLPDGERMPTPPASSALPRLPAYFTAELDGVAFDSVLPRSVTARAYTKILGRRLFQVLRHAHGLSYTTGSNYAFRDRDSATVTAFADALPQKRSQLSGPFVDVLVELASGEVTDGELEAVRRDVDGPESAADRGTALVAGNAFNLLVDAPLTTDEQVRAELAALTAEDVRSVARAALATGLIVLPPGQAVGRAGFTQAPTASAGRITGREYTPKHSPGSRRRLVVGARGVSLTDGPTALTVHFADCSGMVSFADGGRLLYAPDAVVVWIEPQLWNIPQSALSTIDARVPADRVARLPARPPDRLPTPPPPPPVVQPPPVRGRRVRNGLIYLAVTLMVLAVPALAYAAITGGHSIIPVIGAGFAASAGSRYLLDKRSRGNKG